MTLFFLLFTHVVFIGWGIGLSQSLAQEQPWWRRRFRVACLPRADHLFWITRMRRGYTWERAECSAHTFTLWQLPSALLTALRLGARWREIWLKWL